MKTNVKNILNEARVQRTIDPKIWASMSSMSSRLRSTLGEDAKPMKKDDLNTLLQKYVAGLLTMKMPCPNNASEIDDIKAYKLIGNEYLNQGGTISRIQNLYVENGGKLQPGTVIDMPTDDNQEVVTDTIPEISQDDFDEIEDQIISDGLKDMDNEISMPDHARPPMSPTMKNRTEVATETKIDLSNTREYIRTYLKRNREILAANIGQLLAFDENTGKFEIVDESSEKLPVCTGRGFTNIDKKTRFMVISNESYELGNAGNNGVYNDYYFKRETTSTGRLVIKAGSNYYEDEVTKGKFYTEILADNGMIPAMHVQDVVSECDITNPDAIEVLKVSSYLPTLPELNMIAQMLPNGVYWTSSVAKDGTSNIALQVNPDKVLINCGSAKVVAFIRFD